MQELESKREAARLRLKEKNEERQKQEERDKDAQSHTSPDSEQSASETNGTDQTSIEVDQNNTEKKDQYFIAFARVFSGTLRIGEKVYVLGPKYDPSSIYRCR